MSGIPEFYVTGGTLRPDAESYVPRAADRQLYETLSQGQFCYVLTSRQMGKSSLMVRIAQRLREEGVAVVVLDLTALGQNLDAEQWYFGLLGRIGEQLGMEDALEDFWDEHPKISPLQRWMRAIREVILEKSRARLVIFIDEIDFVRSLPFSADEFFAAIRECYNRRTQDHEIVRLTFCLLGVATPSDLIADVWITPFNIGLPIELNDFTPDETAVLAPGLRADPAMAHQLLHRVMHWTSGHPYLTQRLCLAVAQDTRASTPRYVDNICSNVFLSAHARERDDNLHFVRERMLHDEVDKSGLLDLYMRLCRGSRIADDNLNRLVTRLKLAGVVRVQPDGSLAIRNRIYAQVFDLAWAKSNLPEAERERQRAAFIRGVIRTVSYATGAVAVMGLLVIFAFVEARNARVARQQAKAEAERANLEAARANDAKKSADAAAEKAKRVGELFINNQSKLLDQLTPILTTRSQARETVLAFAEKLYDKVPDELAQSPEMLLGRARLLRAFSELYRSLGRTDEALKRAQDALELMRSVAAEESENPVRQLELIESYNTVGEVLNRKRNFDQALGQYRRAFTIAEALASENPDMEEAQQQLAMCNLNIGDIFSRQGRMADSFQAYNAACAIMENMVQEQPDDGALRVALCKCYDRIGDTLLDQNKDDEALAVFNKGLEMRQTLVNKNPEDSERQNDLAISFNKIGRVYNEQGKYDDALTYYQKSLRIRERLAGQDPDNLLWKRNLSYSYNNIGSVFLNRKDYKLALENYNRRLAIAELLVGEDPTNDDWRDDLEEAQNHCAYALLTAMPVQMRNAARALELAEKAVEISGRSDPRFLKTLAQALYQTGRKSEAIAAAQEALWLEPPASLRAELEEKLKGYRR